MTAGPSMPTITAAAATSPARIRSLTIMKSCASTRSATAAPSGPATRHGHEPSRLEGPDRCGAPSVYAHTVIAVAYAQSPVGAEEGELHPSQVAVGEYPPQ